MRFQCSFCLSIIETDFPSGTKVECPSCGRTAFVPKSRFEENCIIADFVIRDKIGSGSIGTVYRAVQLTLERDVALKILSPELTTPKFAASFLREARAAAKLSHTNLVQAFAVGEEDGICYLAMNFIDGESLKNRLEREERIPIDEALHIAQQVAEALYYAWDESRTIHRDVKPDNIMITTDGVVKLTDLGLAINQAEWTEDMEISGSPSYMSPEQFAGEKLDTRSDIYSLGISLYQMISGELPFKGETFQEVAQEHFSVNAPSLARLGLGVSSKVSNLVKKMMEKLPEDRFEDMEGLLKEIWAIRQSTAPDRDLVPDVHTISINRLDYHLQKKSHKEKISAREEVKKLKGRRDFLFWSLISLFPIPIVILLAVVFCRETSKEPEATFMFEEQMKQFQDKFESRDFHPAVLAVEAEQIIESLPKSERTPRQDKIFWNLKYYRERIESNKKEIELREKLAHIKRLESRIRTEWSGKQSVSRKMVKTKSSLEKQIKSYQNQINALKKQIALLGGKVKMAEHGIQAKANLYEITWQERILLQLNRLLHSREFRLASAYLMYSRSQYGKKYYKWFDQYRSWVDQLENIEKLFSGRGVKLPGRKFDRNKRITMVSAGIIYYEDPSGAVRSRSVFDFPPAAVYQLVRSVNPKVAGSQNDFYADFAFLAGQLENPAIIKGRKCTAELARIWMQGQILAVKVLAVQSKEEARQEAESMLTRFRKSPLQAMIRSELKGLIK
jgi:serine/threonine protein kinase